MGPYPSGANPGTATSWPSDQSKQIASITGLRVIDLYYGGARIARDKTGWQGGWAMQSNRLASLVKADAANTPGVIVIYGFYSNDLHDGLTDTKPATDLSKIAAAYKAKFDELKAKYPQARILYALQCMFRSAATEAKPVMTGLPAGTSNRPSNSNVLRQTYTLFEGKGFNVARDWFDWMPDGEKNGYMHDKVHPNAKAMNVAAHKIRE